MLTEKEMKSKIYNDWNEMVKDDDTRAENLKNNENKFKVMLKGQSENYEIKLMYLFESAYYTVDELNTILHRRNMLNEI